ncbi:hypothetical protein OPT61_g8547 [Boeremia exigua]|uniref:Uncharacterized protein n=1 Tax=Boeremia exigua TaxID=749465 RepID=A0ACC2HY72_9PLEO|nr:hypothetical protein OPT61_g8547 [Boeremia exigua]
MSNLIHPTNRQVWPRTLSDDRRADAIIQKCVENKEEKEEDGKPGTVEAEDRQNDAPYVLSRLDTASDNEPALRPAVQTGSNQLRGNSKLDIWGDTW